MDPNQNYNNDPSQNQIPEPVVPPAQEQPVQAPQVSAETEPPTVQESLEQQPQAATSPVTPVGASGENPGQTLGIISIVLDLIGFSVIGIILGVISRKKSKAAGHSTTLGTVGLVLGIIFTVIGLLFLVTIALTAYSGIQQAAQETQNSSLEQSSPSGDFDSSIQE